MLGVLNGLSSFAGRGRPAKTYDVYRSAVLHPSARSLETSPVAPRGDLVLVRSLYPSTWQTCPRSPTTLSLDPSRSASETHGDR